jgi:hypothetical protein
MPDEPNRLKGVLLRLCDQGYGFIHVPGSGDYYAHINHMRDRADWVEKTVVSFVPGKPRPGKATPAYDVVGIKKGTD